MDAADRHTRWDSYQRHSCDATPSANHPDTSDATTGASDTEGPEDRGSPASAVRCQRSRASLCRRLCWSRLLKVDKVIPQEPVSARTVEQTADVPLVQCIDRIVDVPAGKRRLSKYFHRAVHVPVEMLPRTTEIPQEQVHQRTVEAEHQPQLTWTGVRDQWRPRDQPPSRLIRTAPRGSDLFDELKPGCTNSSSTRAVGAAAREQQIQPLKERVRQRTLEQIVNVTGERDKDKSLTVQNVEKQLRSHKPSTSTRSWMCQACANAKNQPPRPPRRQSEFPQIQSEDQCR